MKYAAGCIGLHVNTNKTECMCFKREGAIFTLSGEHLRLEDKFMYFGSSVSSTESDVNICLVKAWTAFDRLSIIWKSDLSYKKPQKFLPSCGCISTTVWMHLMHANKMQREKTRWELHKNATSYLEEILEAAAHKTVYVRPLISESM